MIKKIFCLIMISVILLTACSDRAEPESTDVSEAPQQQASDTVLSDEASSGTDETAITEMSGGSDDQYIPLTTTTITIPEGYTLPRIGMTLEEKNICTTEEFIEACQNGDFSEYSFIAAQKPDANRCYKLEGYLFPDTYEIYDSESPDAIIRRILDNTAQKLSGDVLAKIEASGYTIDETLAIASIIEKEAFGKEHMPLISSVLHNRLDTGMKLQCDVTISYVEGAIKPFIAGDQNRYNEYYNTYKCPGLPSGAICNPGIDAIRAAFEPADTDYFFFVTDSAQNYYYAATWEEHVENDKQRKLINSAD